MTTKERDAIKVGDVVTFELQDHGKQNTGTVVHAGFCGLDVRVKDEVYYILRSEVFKAEKGKV